jgi:hypothetical protein
LSLLDVPVVRLVCLEFPIAGSWLSVVEEAEVVSE